MSLLEIDDVHITYTRDRRVVRAVAGASLTVDRGQIVGLVGESGCGKSTLAKAAVGLVPTASGAVRFDGNPVRVLRRGSRERALRGLQMVFQDPYSSLNPRRRIREQLVDALTLATDYDGDRNERAAELVEMVQMPRDVVTRFPHELSGGQRQRIAIARALAASPRMIIADEALSALDASAQASVANLLVDLTRDLDVGLLFISHDLSVVRQVADVTGVMYLGRIVELGPTADLWANPKHPYTQALIDAVPPPDGLNTLPMDLPGDVPDPAKPPTGCRFHPRCPRSLGTCATSDPPLITVAPRHHAACWLHEPDQSDSSAIHLAEEVL
ncbi:ABC transporter ATP-binding protein [Microbacterium saperdae]